MKKKPFTKWEDVPVVLDIPLVTRIFGLCRSVILKKIYSGELPAHKVGGSWRIDKDDARKWFESC